MAFTIDDFHDLVALLDREPSWRAELRRVLLSSELLDLPEALQRLTVAQLQTEDQMKALAAAQQRTEQRIEELVTAQQRTTEELAGLRAETERQFEAVEQQIAALVRVQQDLVVDVGTLKGWVAEERFRRRAPTVLSRFIRRIRVLDSEELWKLLDPGLARAALTEKDADLVELADMVVRGRLREEPREVYLVVEISWGIGQHDVDRALDRAAALAKVGVEAIPVVAGQWAAREVREYADASRVWYVTDNHASPPAAA